MKKQITIGSQSVDFKVTSKTPFIYKNEFSSDFFGDMISIGSAFNGDQFNPRAAKDVDFTVLTQVAWACAKTADKDTVDFEEWLDTVEDFNIFDHGTTVMNMCLESMNTKKK